VTPPRVFVDARHLDRSPTGVGVWLRAILTEWSASGVEVEPLTRTTTDAPGGTAATPVRAPSALWHAAVAWRTWRARGRYLSPDSFVVPLLLGRRATLVVHDLTPLLLKQAHTRRTWLSHALLLRLAARRVGAVVVPSRATGDDLIRFVPQAAGRVHVVPEAARDLPAPTEAPARAEPFVLYVGTIEPRKNVDVLVRAFSAAAPSDWRLVLAGKLGWLDDDQRAALLADVDADARVELLGYVSDEALAALYRDADLLVYPSSYEGFGLPVLEAMSRGVATVTTDAAALVEVAGDAAARVPLADLEDALVDAIGRLTADPDARAALAASGLERAASFSWRSAAADLLDLVLA